MPIKQLALLSVVFVAFVAGYILLAFTGHDTDNYSVFLAVVILPTITGAYAAKNSAQARDLAQTAVTQTNGNMTTLMEKNQRLVDIIESHGISTTPAEDTAAANDTVTPPTTPPTFPATPPTGSV